MIVFLIFGKAEYKPVRGYKLLIVLMGKVSPLPSVPPSPDFGEFGRGYVTIIVKVLYIVLRLPSLKKKLEGHAMDGERNFHQFPCRRN